MRSIISSIESLPAIRRGPVLEYVAKRFSVNIGAVPITSASQLASSQGDCAAQFAPETGISEFIESKAPKNNYQAIAVLGHYLQHHDQKKDFSTQEIVDANSRAKRSKFGNIHQDIYDAERKYGFVAANPHDAKRKYVTSLAEKVVNVLPDQIKVKALLATYKPRAKKRKLSKK
ncbi:MAG: hypothetical protein KGH63_02815 [Candidatus Micrarchaeota archaeon]|nr:hypothetical protein [Candidatus Micrarchaeota archaeon]